MDLPETKESKEILEEQNKKPKPLNVSCLDTTKLRNLGIIHYMQNDDEKSKWILSNRIVYNQANLKSINYYYSANSIEECDEPINHFQLDSLEVQINDVQYQIFKMPKFTSSSNLSNLDLPNSKIVDINFDGKMDFDLALNEVSGATNELRRYFVFNPLKGQFEQGMDIANLGIDTSQNLLYNSWNGGHAGKISTRTWSEIINYDSLRAVKEIVSNYNKQLNSYIVKTKILKSDETYSIVLDTIIRQ